MSAITEDIIKHLRDLNIQTYKGDKSRIKADYGNERKFTLDYNGRQLLELLQNADDAQTDSVLIELDEANSILRVCNRGQPFTAEGLDSLRLAGNSSKNKREFIGNKGLGFRAILNWVDRVRIITQEYLLEFSPEIATRLFQQLIPDAEERRAIIEKQEDILPGTSPFAILAYPEYEKNEIKHDWQTIIELKYKREIAGDILDQLEQLTPQVLLFLNYTKQIDILHNGQLLQCLKRTDLLTDGNESRVQVNNLIYNIIDSGECTFPDEEKKFYRYKLAWRDDLSAEHNVFYSFFPTRVISQVPCLIHGTFELTMDRNQLVKHPHNDFILKEIATMLGWIAENKLIDQSNPNWQAYKFLFPLLPNNDERLATFYSSLETSRKNLEIYPSLDGSYYNVGSLVYYGKLFSDWVTKRKLQKHFSFLLSTFPESNGELRLYKWKIYNTDYLLGVISALSPQIKSLKIRCELIRILTTDRFKAQHKIKFPLLLSSESDQPVAADVEVFLTKQGSVEQFRIPSYVKLKFIAKDLAKALEREFVQEMVERKIKGEDNSRTLKRVAGSAVNLGSNDITDVIIAVTRSFNKKRERPLQLSTQYRIFKEYVGCLFRIFNSNPERRGTLNDNIYLLNRSGEAVRSNELFLGKGFRSGEFTEELFEDVYEERDYVMDRVFWQLEDNSGYDNMVEEFFIWLGVNRLTRLKADLPMRRDRYDTRGYADYVFDKTRRPESLTSLEYQVTTIVSLERILAAPKFTLERLIAWLIKDPVLRQLLHDDANGDKFSYCYVNWYPVSIKPSYLKYELDRHGIFKNVFADPTIARLLGLKAVNVRDPLFAKWKITESQVLETLRQVGAMISLIDLTPERIFKLLNAAGDQAISSIRLYETALIYFKQNEDKDFSAYLKGLKVWAIKGDERQFLSSQDVYYTDHITLPETITADFWMLDFPKKRGEQQIARFFGVRTFRDLKLSLHGEPAPHSASIDFEKWMDIIKPYLLTYRLQNLREDAASRKELPSMEEELPEGNESVNALKRLCIYLVSTAQYSIDNGPSKTLAIGEFIPTGNRKFYLCFDREATLNEIKNSPACCEAIAEILCMLFRTQKNKDDFRSVFKDGDDLRDTKFRISTNSLNHVFDDAQRLLGISGAEKDFWRAVLLCKDKQLPDQVITRESLKSFLFETLEWCPVETGKVDFEFWNTSASINLLRVLFERTGLTPADIHRHHAFFPGIKMWHYEKLCMQIYDYQKPWIYALWKSMMGKSREAQKCFHKRRNSYNSIANNVAEFLAKTNAYDLNLLYGEEFAKELIRQSNLELTDRKNSEIHIVVQYRDMLTEAGVDKDELSEDLQGLLFFKGHSDVLKAELEKLRAHLTESSETYGHPNAVVPLNRTSFGKSKVAPGVAGNYAGRKPGTYNGKSEVRNNRAGKKAEMLVRNTLVQNFPDGVVHWLSRYSDDETLNKDDGAGYDIRYKCNKEDEEWFLVEVKSVSQDSFIISLPEVLVGLAQREHYQLAIVHGEQIYLDEQYFQNEDTARIFESFVQNSTVQPLAFEVGWVM